MDEASFAHNLALYLHLLGAFLFIAGIVVAGVAFESAKRRERPAEIALLLGLTRAGVLLVAIGALVIPACGLWLVAIEEDLDYGTGWIVAALALFVAALALGGFGGQRPKQARKLATRLASEGEEATPELRRLLDDPVSQATNYASGLLVLVILVLMVWKP